MSSTQEFVAVVQRRTARVAVGASTVRGQGTAGLVAAARTFLSHVPLAQFGVRQPTLFRGRLDIVTDELVRAFPPRGRSWGLARKVLNIFLRDALYTSYLQNAFRLERAEALYELPLDSITAKQLRAAAGRGRLSRWAGVKRLTPELNERYQVVAAEIARRRSVARVHLDAYWWGDRDGDGAT